MAVGGVDVVAQPDAGVGDAQLGLAQPPCDPRRGLPRRQGAVLEAESAAADRQLLQQRLGQAVVVVAGDEHDAAPGHRLAQLLEERLYGSQHLGQGSSRSSRASPSRTSRRRC